MKAEKVLLMALLFFVAAPVSAKKKPVLRETKGWVSDTLRTGVVYHHFHGYDDISGAHQNVDVLEIDQKSDSFLRFIYYAQSDSLSGIIERERQNGHHVIGGINAAYEPEAVYIRVDGQDYSEVTLPEGHLRYWKHENAVFLDAKGRLSFSKLYRDKAVKAISEYKKSKAVGILSSAPMLINDFKPVGCSFLEPQYRNWTISQLETLDYEDMNRHQGVRHPRTVVAETKNHHVLLITIDGRREGISEGMSAKETTLFIEKWFHPRHALNLDGGGSTTMCIEGKGHSLTNVVNYPTDNKRYDHAGQRRVSTFILIEQK